MASKDLTLHIEGHPGHRGNPLAHALVEKLQKLLSALGQAERAFIDKRARQTDYEIVSAGKVNPTHLTLHPIPRRGHYDPLPAFDWTFEQIELVARGEKVDERVDAALARTLSEIAKKSHEEDYCNLWITVDDRKVVFDETFRIRSEAIANQKTEDERPQRWFAGISYGSVVGDLKEVADADGERQFVIIPPAGADRINCTFPESKREQIHADVSPRAMIPLISQYLPEMSGGTTSSKSNG